MDTLAIRRMRNRCRLPAGDTGVLRARVAAVTDDLLDGALGAALERAGVRPEEEVCVRRVLVRTRLARRRSDAALAADWGAAIAEALRTTMTRGGADVVRYGSRMHAWIDCAEGVARGDLARAWAWRRLLGWRGGDDAGPASAAAALVRALAAEGHAVVPVLTGLARGGTLASLAQHLDEAAWFLLAAAALDAHEAPRALLAVEASAADSLAPSAADGAAEPVVSASDAVQSLRTSPLAALAAWVQPHTAVPIAVLVRLAAEPAFARRAGETARAQVAALARGMLARARGIEEPPGATPGETREPFSRRATAHRPERRSTSTGRGPDKKSAATVYGDAAEARRTPDETRPQTRATEPEQSPEPNTPSPPASVRTEGETDWGGLLLLLNVLASIPSFPRFECSPDDAQRGVGAPDGTLRPLAARPLRWTLHRLALALVPAREDDAAVLAFCGLAPDAAPPSHGESPPDADEARAIAALALAVTTRLHAAIGTQDEAPDVLRLRLAHRPARILADPGWIEVRYPLATLATPVRRAGLDLNPDWLPWLGAVVRFVYE